MLLVIPLMVALLVFEFLELKQSRSVEEYNLTGFGYADSVDLNGQS